MSWLRSCLWVLDSRSPAEVRDDVAAEFAHHMECLRDDLAAREGAGVPPGEIDAMVAARFGDAAVYARACERIALKERIMLQRINLVLLVLVSVLIGWNAWASTRAAGQNAAALEKPAARLDSMGSVDRSGERTAARGVATDPAAEVISVSGPLTVGRPGMYSHTKNLSVRRLLIAADFRPQVWKEDAPVRVLRMTSPGSNSVVFTLSRAEFESPTGNDFVLAPGDSVQAP